MATNQQYCLRWNNHRSNLLLVFEHLFHTEAFTDVTLACDGHSIKCHKMVLAACSSYFQQLFLENDCRHPIVILKDILFSEVKAILEYMYKGEVNVGQDQLSGLLKAAETLKVKGLVEDHQRASAAAGGTGGSSPHSSTPFQSQVPANASGGSRPSIPPSSSSGPPLDYENSVAQSSYPKANHLPQSKFIPESPYSAVVSDRNSIPFHVWPSTKLPSASSSPIHHGGVSTISTTYENSVESTSCFKRKKMYYSIGSSANPNFTNKDTPILRTVLGHNAGTVGVNCEPQVKSINYSMSGGGTPNSNGPADANEKALRESPDTYFDDSIRSVESDKMHEDNHSFGLDSDDMKTGLGYGSGSNQKPEWKRYKQYTRNDIMAAIEAVRAGMSALQAARKYGVPSRTLYDKVKKLGITTNRPYRKGSFPMSPYQGLNLKMEDMSGYSPEEPLDVSSTGNGNGTTNAQEGDSDKIDSDPGSSSIKQEHSPRIEDLEESPQYERQEEGNLENEAKGPETPSQGSVLVPPRQQPPPPQPSFPTYLNGSYFGA